MSRGNICRHRQVKLAVSASPAPVLEEISELIHAHALHDRCPIKTDHGAEFHYLRGNWQADPLHLVSLLHQFTEYVMKQAHAVVWLKASTIFAIGFGLMMVAAAVPALSAPMNFLLDLVFSPLDGAQGMGDPQVRLLSAIGGGVMVGWGCAIWMILTRLVPGDAQLARSILLVSLCTWFVVDSTGSVLSGGHWNVVGNIGFLLIFLIPALQLRAVVGRTA